MFVFLFSLMAIFAQANEDPKCIAEYDALGVTHQRVASIEELYYCFGLHHGKDRAWEMDFFRRVGLGTNSEVLGFSHLKSDLMMRLIDLPSLAAKIWNGFPSEQKTRFELYSKGANAGFIEGKNAKEFKQLGHTPDPWLPEHSILVLLLQSFDQTRKTFILDYDEELAKENWNDQAHDLFDDDGPPWQNTVLKAGEYSLRKVSHHAPQEIKKNIKLWSHFPTVFGEQSGSNNWAISKHKSKTGNAIFANDPHLDLKTPIFWYWIHLKSPEHEIIGASVPGMPVIASGTNGKVAWGLTNSYINTADAVLLNDISHDQVETIRPVVWAKLWFFKVPFFFKAFQRLKSGHPILPLELKSHGNLALRWTGHGLTADDIVPMLDLINVKDVVEAQALFRKVGVPAWNFVFADTNGDIGYQMVGQAYKHEYKHPFGIPSMGLKDFLKEDLLTPEERPSLLRPKRNYIHTANNRHWPLDAALYGGRGYSYSFRALRIDEMLQGQHDTESFKAIQCDTQVVDARFFLQKLLKYLKDDLLAEWVPDAHDGSRGLPIYRRLMDILMEEWKVNEYALYRLLDDLDDEKRLKLQAHYETAKKDVDGRTWGEIHRVPFSHLSKNSDWKFSPEMAGPGDNHSVNPGTSRWDNKKKIYEHYSGASMRLIIEMSKRPKIQLVLPGINRQYTEPGPSNPWKDWKECRYSVVEF